MSKGLIGRKVGMTMVFAEDGTAHPVTVIEVEPNLVFGHRTKERDGYSALQLAHEELSEKEQRNARKPDLGAFKKRSQKPHRTVREFRVEEKELEGHALGSQVTVELFKKGDKVDVTGTTRGFGFAGVFKRHHMKGAARDSSTAHELHRHPSAGDSVAVSQLMTSRSSWSLHTRFRLGFSPASRISRAPCKALSPLRRYGGGGGGGPRCRDGRRRCRAIGCRSWSSGLGGPGSSGSGCTSRGL